MQHFLPSFCCFDASSVIFYGIFSPVFFFIIYVQFSSALIPLLHPLTSLKRILSDFTKFLGILHIFLPLSASVRKKLNKMNFSTNNHHDSWDYVQKTSDYFRTPNIVSICSTLTGSFKHTHYNNCFELRFPLLHLISYSWWTITMREYVLSFGFLWCKR